MTDSRETLKSDPEFLLRCAHTHNWDVLIDFCAYLVETFTLSVPDRYQESHNARIADAKRQLLSKDQWRNTALMAACYHRPPLRVVTSILNAARMVPGNPIQLHLLKARDGSTALQVACACGASKRIIRALLNPSGGLMSGARLVAVADQQGGTPLSELVVQYSLERKGAQHRASIALDQVNLIGDEHSVLFDVFWSKVETLFRAAWTCDQADMLRHSTSGAFPLQSLRDSFISLVHAAAKVPESCPPDLMSLICRCYPHMLSFTDRKGVLPLHLAVTTDMVQSQAHKRAVLVKRRNHCIQTLVDIYPQAARVLLPGSNRTPFCQAVASGLHWHGPAGMPGALQILWTKAPELLVQKDSMTLQFPFLLAASTLPLDPAERKSDDACQLDTVYNLLRLHPQLLHESLESNIVPCTEWCHFGSTPTATAGAAL